MKTYLILGCAMALAATPVFSADSPKNGEQETASAQKPAPAQADGKQKPSFKDIDTDGDGYISSVEAYVAGFTVGSMDTDKDGRVSEQEYNAAQAKNVHPVAGDHQSADASKGSSDAAAESHLNESLGQPGTAPERDLSFQEVDSNGDGVIDEEEAAVAELGKGVDTNHDGKISKEEFETAKAKKEKGNTSVNEQQSAQSAKADQ